jgi:xanthine dehydrogenase accessory factor
MAAFYRELAGFAERGEPVVVATVIGARGSTPREVGAKMLVRRDGSIVGSVGGGCGEAQVFWEAARVLEEGRSRICEVDLTGEINDESATNCGGVMEVFVDRAAWAPAASVGLSEAECVRLALQARGERRALALVVVVANPDGLGEIPVGAKWIVEAGRPLAGAAPQGLDALLNEVGADALATGRSGRFWARPADSTWERAPEEDGMACFVETLEPADEVVVVGAGHIAVPLVRMVKLLDFDVALLDDRSAFANRERFPDADLILVGPIAERLRAHPIGPRTYVVLITRGHQHDEAALKAVIGSEAAYIGMIGSRRRVKEVFRHLIDAGIPEEWTARIHAPIGLDIGAETPAEIATAIVAELVQVRRAPVRERDRLCAPR